MRNLCCCYAKVVHGELPNDCEGAENSPKYHKYLLQYSRFASKYLRFENGGANNASCLFLPQAPCDLVTHLPMMSQENGLDQYMYNPFSNFDDNVHNRADLFLWL